jgi:hypothetical protein
LDPAAQKGQKNTFLACNGGVTPLALRRQSLLAQELPRPGDGNRPIAHPVSSAKREPYVTFENQIDEIGLFASPEDGSALPDRTGLCGLDETIQLAIPPRDDLEGHCSS